MKIKYLTFIYLLMGLFFNNCRPQLDNSVTNSEVFDYNFNGFITEKNDSIPSNTWVSYELYLKPISTSLLKEVNKSIVFKPTIDKDVKTYYQLYDLSGKSISTEQRTGDVCSISSEQLVDDKCYLKIKVMPPNALGKFNLLVGVTWNGIHKNITKPVVVVR
jgi:hypothetical protein